MALNFKQIGLGMLGILRILVSIGLGILVAIGIKTGIKYYNSENKEVTAKDILSFFEEKGLIKEMQDGTVRLSSSLSADGKGVILYLLLPADVISDLKPEGKKMVQENYNSIAGALFCESIAKKDQLGRFFTSSNSNYISMVVGDEQVLEGLEIKINREFCNNYSIQKSINKSRGEKDWGDLAIKQEKQGYYDDEYLQELVKVDKLHMPITLEEDLLEIYNASAKDRELTYYVRPLPGADRDAYIKGFDPKVVKEFLSEYYCSTPYFKKSIIPNVKAVNFVFDDVSDNKVQINKADCK